MAETESKRTLTMAFTPEQARHLWEVSVPLRERAILYFPYPPTSRMVGALL